MRLLLAELTSGSIGRGDRLPNERDLAGHFGVSQPTVREAIRALDAMGLIEVRHGSGAYATGSSDQLVELALRTLIQMEGVSILDALEIRFILGDYSARRATESATDEDIELVVKAADDLADLSDVSDLRGIAQKVVEFQVLFSRATHNSLVVALEVFLIELLMQLQLAGRPSTLDSWRAYVEGFTDDRRRLAQALRDRQPDRVAELMRAYLDHQHDVFVSDQNLTDPGIARSGSIARLISAADDLPRLFDRRRSV